MIEKAAMGGVTNCEKHGNTVAVVWVCEHVRTQIEAGETPVGHRLDACVLLMVCAYCFRSGGFEEVAKVPGPPFPLEEYRNLSPEMRDKYDDWQVEMIKAISKPFDALQNRRAYCEHCFEELNAEDLADPAR